MTDEQRELAEWVARWAGWELDTRNDMRLWIHPSSGHDHTVDQMTGRILADNALAFRALVELTEQDRQPALLLASYGFCVEVAEPGSSRVEAKESGPTLHEAIFRALRAVKGE